jgi:plasmid maintenance system antidote protein VapI
MSKLLIIIKGVPYMKKFEPITPGEILSEEFLKPMGLSQYRLAKKLTFQPNVSAR